MGETTVTLYHAKWCPPCKAFFPIWKKAKDTNAFGNDIKMVSYEATANPDIMNQNDIKGFPTIRISRNNMTEEYTGARTIEGLRAAINNQDGGGCSCGSRSKYMKYKAKYMELKNKLYKSSN